MSIMNDIRYKRIDEINKELRGFISKKDREKLEAEKERLSKMNDDSDRLESNLMGL